MPGAGAAPWPSPPTSARTARLLSRADRALYRVEGALALIAGLAVLSLMGLAVVSVGGRNFFGTPLPGYVDWIEQIMPAIALLGIAYTQRTGGHIRLDLRRRPVLGAGALGRPNGSRRSSPSS